MYGREIALLIRNQKATNSFVKEKPDDKNGIK